MTDERWNVPQTEEGLQTLLTRLEESRAAGDEAAVGFGLLALGYQVKWVRSDNHESPFTRAHKLAQEALAIFRRLGNVRGQVRALHAAAPFAPMGEGERMLAEAARIATESGDEVLVARSLVAQARAIGLRDRAEAVRLSRQALETFLRHGEKLSAAACLFGLAVYPDSLREKYEAARESAQLYREVGEFGHASRSASVAIMNGEEFLPFVELAPLIHQGLADAQKESDRSLEGVFYFHLAKLAIEQGQPDKAAKYLRWQNDIEESDGLAPKERRKNDIEMTKQLIAIAKASGNGESETMFKDELKRLSKTRVE